MTAHVFHYKFPKIKVDLVHEEHQFDQALWKLTMIPAPIKAFVYCEGAWYQKTAVHNFNQVKENQVPKEIRLHMLLLM